MSIAFTHAAAKTVPIRALAASPSGARPFAATAIRTIAIGSDLKTSLLSWQKARPWYMSDAEGSNLAKDNLVHLKDLFAGKNVAVFGVPAPFTGTCTNAHFPPYKKLAPDFAKAGADALICYTVSDPYAHFHWGKALGNNFDEIQFLADPEAQWAIENKLERDFGGTSLGIRSARFSMYVKDGIVKSFRTIDNDEAEFDAEILLGDVKAIK